MICCMSMANPSGTTASGWIIQTPMVPAVPFHRAIASNLAQGYDMKTSVKNAKEYITGALKDGLDLGKGSGPLNHAYRITGK